VGAFLTHVPAHVSAVVHQEEGGNTQMLPPKVTADYRSHGDSDLAAGLRTSAGVRRGSIRPPRQHPGEEPGGGSQAWVSRLSPPPGAPPGTQVIAVRAERRLGG
jgi:hypothetical protein